MKIEIELPDGFTAEVKQTHSKLTIKVVKVGTAKKITTSSAVPMKSVKSTLPTSGKTTHAASSVAGRVLVRPAVKKAAARTGAATLGGTTSTGPKKPNVKY